MSSKLRLSSSHARTYRAALVALIACMRFEPAAAQAAEHAENVTVQKLQEELAKRDAVIVDLLNRVRALESELATGSERRAAADGEAGAAQNGLDGTAEPAAAPSTTSAPASKAAGEPEIGRLQAERALERSLVQQGARLLPPGEIEIAPGFALSRYEGGFPTLLMTADQDVVGQRQRTFDVYDWRTDLRLGLPWRSQLEIGLPYRRVSEQISTDVDGIVQAAENMSGAGFGDVTLGLAKTFGAGDSQPNLIGRLVWLTGSGTERTGGVSLGGGMPGAAARLSAYWRRDPVIFLVGGGYTHYSPDAGAQAGDTLDASLGLALAVSPETALFFSLDQTFRSAFKRDGVELPGTDGVSSTLRVSASTILGRRLFLLVDTGIGLTQDAPDYRFGVSLSSRFDPK
jgi:hypothetical protein